MRLREIIPPFSMDVPDPSAILQGAGTSDLFMHAGHHGALGINLGGAGLRREGRHCEAKGEKKRANDHCLLLWREAVARPPRSLVDFGFNPWFYPVVAAISLILLTLPTGLRQSYIQLFNTKRGRKRSH
jgi:hypothetical protein